jgi:hypothetical protein
VFDPAILKETQIRFDVDKILDVYKLVESYKTADNQIAITSYSGSDLLSGVGRIESLHHQEKDYSKLNSPFIGTYLEEVHNTLVSEFNVVRGRFMNLPGKRCYTYHVDPTWRLHIPLIANPSSIFVIADKVYRLPNMGSVYLINTTIVHTAINMSVYDRLHIVYGMQ